jgi:phenylacetate-CoA ligase
MLQFADLTRANYMATTPSLAEYLIIKAPETIKKEVADLKLKGVMLTGEIGAGLTEVKKRLEEVYGCRVYDYWAPMSHAIGISCDSDDYYGMHGVSPDLCTSFEDLVDPSTKKPIAIGDGAVGEMVITSLIREACPLVKYASGDIIKVYLEPCPNCGFPGKRIKVVGRSDDMLVVKGVNVYPASIKQVVTTFVPKITGEMRIVLTEPPPRVVPPLKLKLEHGAEMQELDLEGLGNDISLALHNKLKIRPSIEWVRPGSLEKSTRKAPIFERLYEKT